MSSHRRLDRANGRVSQSTRRPSRSTFGPRHSRQRTRSRERESSPSRRESRRGSRRESRLRGQSHNVQTRHHSRSRSRTRTRTRTRTRRDSTRHQRQSTRSSEGKSRDNDRKLGELEEEKQQQQQQQREIMASAKKLLKEQRAFEKKEKQKEDEEKTVIAKNNIKHHCSEVTKILSVPELREMVKNLINEGLIDKSDISLEQLKTWNRFELCRKLDSLLKLELSSYNDENVPYGGVLFRDLINQANEELDILPEWTKDQVSFEYMKTPYKMIGLVDGKIQSSTKHYDSSTWSTLVNRALEVESDLLDPTTRRVLIKHEDLTEGTASVSHENDSMRVNLDLKNAIEEWIIRHTGLSEDQYDSMLKAEAPKLEIKQQMFRRSLYGPFIQDCKEIQEMYSTVKRIFVDCFDDGGKINHINIPMHMDTTWIVLILSAIREMKWRKEDCMWRVGQNGFWSSNYVGNNNLIFTSVKSTLMKGSGRGSLKEQVLQIKLKNIISRSSSSSSSSSSLLPQMEEHPRIRIVTEEKVLGTFDVQWTEQYNNTYGSRQIITESFEQLFQRYSELNSLLPYVKRGSYWWSGTGETEESLFHGEIMGRGGCWGSNDSDYLFVGSKISKEVADHLGKLNEEFNSRVNQERNNDVSLAVTPLVSQYNHTIDSLTNLNKQPKIRVHYYETRDGIDTKHAFDLPFDYKTQWVNIISNIEQQLFEAKIQLSEFSELLIRFGESDFWKPLESSLFQGADSEQTVANFISKDCSINIIEISDKKRRQPTLGLLPKIHLIMNEISYGEFDIQPNSVIDNASESFYEFFTRNRLLDLWNTTIRNEAITTEPFYFLSGHGFDKIEPQITKPISDYIKYTGRSVNTLIVGLHSMRTLSNILGDIDLVDIDIEYKHHRRTKSVTIRKNDVYNVKLRELFERIGELENNDPTMFTEQHLYSIKIANRWYVYNTVQHINRDLNDNISEVFIMKDLKRRLRKYNHLTIKIRLKEDDAKNSVTEEKDDVDNDVDNDDDDDDDDESVEPDHEESSDDDPDDPNDNDDPDPDDNDIDIP